MKSHIGQSSTASTSARNDRAREAARTAKDAIALLEEDHVEARALLAALRESSERAVQKRERTLAKLATTLWIHMQVEEELFYSAFEGAFSTADDEVRAYEARAEHESVKAALRRLEGADPSSTYFRAMAKVVLDLVDHHATEDANETFPRMRALFTKPELVQLGVRLSQRRQELVARRTPVYASVSA